MPVIKNNENTNKYRKLLKKLDEVDVRRLRRVDTRLPYQ